MSGWSLPGIRSICWLRDIIGPMERLLILRDSDVIKGATDDVPLAFGLRRAARAVVTDDSGRVALLYVGAHGYHKLPGGGVEPGEDILQAVEREVLEEVGCRAELLSEVGEIIEYRSEWKLKQISDCYLAELIGDVGEPTFTDKELSEGFAVVWAEDIDAAIKLLKHDKPTDYDGRFIQRRDRRFLEAAREQL